MYVRTYVCIFFETRIAALVHHTGRENDVRKDACESQRGTCTCVCVDVCFYACICACMYVLYIHIFVHVDVPMCMCTHISLLPLQEPRVSVLRDDVLAPVPESRGGLAAKMLAAVGQHLSWGVVAASPKASSYQPLNLP